ncbi:MAG: hypothetical protein JSS56_07885 [Proteobacteria bacterium]|nr:hypothetical protein [Pseudomonadota bacterium]
MSTLRGSIEVRLIRFRQRTLDALVIGTRSVVPTPDLNIERASEMRAVAICRRGHPLLAESSKQGVTFDDVLRYPLRWPRSSFNTSGHGPTRSRRYDYAA